MTDTKFLDADRITSFLREVGSKLLEIDEEQLSQNDKNSLARALDAVTTVKNQLVGIQLQSLNAKFEDIEKKLKQGTGKLEKDLASLETTVLAIKTVVAGIETMSEVLKAFELPI
jgi:hypothetical protein